MTTTLTAPSAHFDPYEFSPAVARATDYLAAVRAAARPAGSPSRQQLITAAARKAAQSETVPSEAEAEEVLAAEAAGQVADVYRNLVAETLGHGEGRVREAKAKAVPAAQQACRERLADIIAEAEPLVGGPLRAVRTAVDAVEKDAATPWRALVALSEDLRSLRATFLSITYPAPGSGEERGNLQRQWDRLGPVRQVLDVVGIGFAPDGGVVLRPGWPDPATEPVALLRWIVESGFSPWLPSAAELGSASADLAVLIDARDQARKDPQGSFAQDLIGKSPTDIVEYVRASRPINVPTRRMGF